METQIQNRMEHYLALYEELQRKVADVSVASAIMNQVGKDMRMAQIRAWNGNNVPTESNGLEPASSKQIGYLKSLGVKVPTELSKQQASGLIDEATGNGKS